jgi:hypothetical protein
MYCKLQYISTKITISQIAIGFKKKRNACGKLLDYAKTVMLSEAKRSRNICGCLCRPSHKRGCHILDPAVGSRGESQRSSPFVAFAFLAVIPEGNLLFAATNASAEAPAKIRNPLIIVFGTFRK